MGVGVVLRACLVGLLLMKHPKWVTKNQHAVVGRTFQNIGIQMCLDKCRHIARCKHFIFETSSLTCHLRSVRTSKEQILLHIKRSERKWSRCPNRSCRYAWKCLTTRLGGSKCIRTGRIRYATSHSWPIRKSTSTSVKFIRHVAKSFTEDAIYGFTSELTLSMNYVIIAYNGSFEDATIQLNPGRRSRSYACSIHSMSSTPWREFTCVYIVGTLAGETKQRLVYFVQYTSHRGSLHDNNMFLQSKLSILSMAVCKYGAIYILESLNSIHYYQTRQNVLIFKERIALTYPVRSVHFAFKKAELSLVTLTEIRTFDFPLQSSVSPKYSDKANIVTWKIMCLSPDEMTFLQVDHNRPFRFKAIK